MIKKRWFVVALWVAILTTAAVIIWQMQSENSASGNQAVESNNGPAEQPSAGPTFDTQSSDPVSDVAFKMQVLNFYEILHTEDQSKQAEMLPSVATKRYITSDHWHLRNGKSTVSTSVDPARSNVTFEESETDKNVRFVTTVAYVIKVDATTNDRYEDLYPVNDTTWILEADGVWRVYGPTRTHNDSTQL